MGIYLNPGNEVYRQISGAEYYVDKTMMLEVINRKIDSIDKYICMSRPRRFGKTVTQNMMAAYYSKGCDSRELFEGRKIAEVPGYEDCLNKYNVIQLDLNNEYQNTKDRESLIVSVQEKIKKELAEEYSDIVFEEKDTLAEAILKVYAAKGDTFIILIDEYDVLVREQVSKKLFDEFLSFLNGLFKSNTMSPAISLAYLTGILPVVRDKVQSKLNNLREYTFLNAGKFAEYVGFIPEEVKGLCEKYDVDYEECRHWYDGYTVNGFEIYNPESVVMCMEDGYFEGYWGKTSSYRVISDRISQNFKGIKDDVIRMLAGEEIDVNVTGYMNTMDSFYTKDDVFTYLLHVGYIAYNREKKTCRIPNREVRQEWINAVAADSEYEVTDTIIKDSKALLAATLNGDEENVAAALDFSHIHVTSNRSYNNEDALQSAIYLAYIYALNEYTVVKEMTTGKGFADVVFIPVKPGKPAMIIELKHNRSAESAIDQIKKKEYFDSLSKYEGDLIFVGINYDEKEKTHTCRIERFEKDE